MTPDPGAEPPAIRITAVVLAGGRAARFGGEKLAAELDGVPLLDLAIRAVAGVADEILVADRGVPGPAEPGHAGRDGPPIRSIADTEPFDGPLAALAGVLPEARGDLAIVVGGDMPGLVAEVLVAMLDRLRSDPDLDAITLAAPPIVSGPPVEGAEPPRRQVLPLALCIGPARTAAQATLDAGDRSLVRFLGRLRSIDLPAAEWLALDPGGRTLLDVDRPEDLVRIRSEFR